MDHYDTTIVMSVKMNHFPSIFSMWKLKSTCVKLHCDRPVKSDMQLQMTALWKVSSFVFVCSGCLCALTHQCSSRSVCSTTQDSLLLYWALTLALSAEQSAVEWHRKSIWYLKSHIERELLNDYAQQSFAWEVELYRPVTPQASWEDLFFTQIFLKPI